MPVGPRGLKHGFTLDGRGKRRRVGLPSGSQFRLAFHGLDDHRLLDDQFGLELGEHHLRLRRGLELRLSHCCKRLRRRYRLGQRLRLEDGRRGGGEL